MIKSGSRELNRTAAKFLSAVSLSVLAVGTAHAQSTAAQEAAAEEAPADAGDAIVVTGFRASLEAALKNEFLVTQSASLITNSSTPYWFFLNSKLL